METVGKVLFCTLVVLSISLAAKNSFAINDCLYSGVNFSDGAVSCQSGHQFRCSDGDWQSLDLPCATPSPPPTVVNPAACACTQAEMSDCDQKGENCCVSLESGSCVKRCCPR